MARWLRDLPRVAAAEQMMACGHDVLRAVLAAAADVVAWALGRAVDPFPEACCGVLPLAGGSFVCGCAGVAAQGLGARGLLRMTPGPRAPGAGRWWRLPLRAHGQRAVSSALLAPFWVRAQSYV
eukprot:Amastigsp_a867333_4.p3 type:complete len:124 gc:universal Amastigsp_a867333_4:384-13(-)